MYSPYIESVLKSTKRHICTCSVRDKYCVDKCPFQSFAKMMLTIYTTVHITYTTVVLRNENVYSAEMH